MAKYEISHPELPQVRGILELKDGEEPSDQHFWEAAKTMVRPYGASQLSNEAKISAYKNGFFDTPSGPILDVDDDPETIQDEKSPGLLSTLGDMVDNLGTRIDPLTSPYSKVLQLDDEAVSYDKTENIEQFREAGKRLFGLLDNQESLGDLGFDPISEALKQTGMPFYQKNKDARGRVKAAAMDYASDNIKSSVGMGTARAWKTPEFLLRGGAALSNYLTLDEEDDGEVLSYVNSLIGFDKVNSEYETAAEFAAWVMDNPVDALKGTVGIEPESMTFDSQLEQDLRSDFQVPSEGIGLAFEVVGDPLNAAGGTLAKGVTAPMRIGLKGRMLKTIQDVQQKTIQLAKYQNTLQKLPTDIANKSLQALIRSRITKESAKLADELAEQQKVLQKYGSNSLHLRLMGKASPETLGKVAMETFDQSTDAGKMGMGLVQEATKATDKMSKLRRVANTAAKLNPEIAGASVGALVAGPVGAAVGASLPTIAKIGRFLSSMTENSAIRYIINAERQAGREVTIESARRRYKNFKNLSGTALGLGSAAGFSFDQDALGGGAAIAALTAFIGPKALSLYDNIVRDARVVGSELTLARTGDHTPFFRRLSMLPTPDQGLAGATMDKFNILMKPSPEGLASRVGDAIAQGSRASAKEVNPSAQPFRVGPGGEKIGQAPTISNATQKVANFLDNAGAVGRLGTPLETLGRFGKGMAAGASLPATIGFVASAGQPSGAVAGAIMSAPFTALGAGAGMYENFKTKGDLYSKQIGDIQYYREHLTKSEQAEFDAMPAHIRTQVAGYSLSHPDVVFKQTTEGEGGFNPITMEVSYNPNGSGYLKGTLAHELTHFMEVHGLTPMVNRILFGDKETKTAGEFASYDKDGNIVYTDEFIGYTDKDGNYVEGLRDIYMDRLRKDTSLDPDAVAAYESDPTKIGREIFADQGADFLLTGKREKALNQGPAGKAIQATIDGITGVSFLRDFLLKLNQPLNADGKFITSTDLFKGKLRKIPELQNLIEKYYKDVRGLKKAEIEGSEFTDPNTGKTRKTEGKKPIDDEFETLYTVEDQKNPNVVDKLNTGGIYKTNPQTGEIEKDALGNPIRMTKGEADKVSEAAGDHAADVLRKNGVDVETNDKGRPFVKDLPALSEAVIDQLANGPIHPRQIAALREISRALRQGDGERAGMLIGYYAATQGRKPKAVPFALRTTMPYGFELTAQGNILVRLHDVGQIQKNLEFLKGERQPKKLPDDLIGMYDELFGNDNAVWDAFSLYRQNTANGIDGRTGLDADPVIANKKLNFLNALHGGITKSQVAMNPVLDSIGYNMSAINKKQNPFGPATKTFRLDRVFNAERSGKASPVNEQRVINLMSPEAQKLYTPKPEADVTVTEKLFMPGEKGDGNNNLIPFPKAKSDPASLPGVKRTFFQQDILDGLADKGLISFEAGKNNTVIAKVSTDGYPMPDYLTINKDGSVEQAKPKLFMPASEKKGYSVTEMPAKHFGEDVQKFRITHDESGGFIDVVLNFLGKNSVTQLLVPESARRQGIGKDLQQTAQEFYPNIGGQVSSKYAAKSAYDLGRRPPDNPKASLEEVFKAIDQDSSVNLVSQSQDKLFMPASEAGAGKGKQAEAAKLWNEKGEDSPYFKKWFGKSKVVDENGKPLVVKHGTSDYGFNIFDFSKLGERTGAKSAEEGIFFTSSEAVADGYAHLGEGDTFAPMVEQIKKLESQLNDLQKTPLKEITPQLQETYAKLESQKNEIGRELHQARMQRGSIIDSGGLPPKAPGAGVYSTYLSFQNPKIVDLKGKTARALDQAQTFTDIIKEAKANGHDSVIFKNAKDNATRDTVNIESDIFVAFSPEQIKSATGNRGTFDAGERNILFMPASEAKNLKSGDMLTLDDKSLKLFLPSPSNPNASLSEFKGKNVQVLTSDLSVVGDKKADGVDVAFTGGPGYLSVNDAWGFTNEGSSKSFKTRWERDGKPLIGITSMKQDNHKASSLTREYYVRKFMQAINEGKISENIVNRHIRAALKRAIKGKGLTDNQKAALKTVKTIEDFLRVFPDKELIPWKATPIIYDKLNIKKELPITQVRLKKLGLDTDTILRETRQPEYNDIQKGSLLAIAEYDGTNAVYRPDLNTAYPWSIPLKEKAFLKEFTDIQDLSSRQDLRGSDGEANIGVAMGAGVMLDRLSRGNVNFMPSDPKAPKAQPANRIQQQAPSMPGNRFMAPAASAGAKLSERFR